LQYWWEELWDQVALLYGLALSDDEWGADEKGLDADVLAAARDFLSSGGLDISVLHKRA
jgi:hypothetical protein